MSFTMINADAIVGFSIALLAALIPIVQATISKESKVSELRASWIAQLRSEVSEYAAAINQAATLTDSYVFKSSESSVPEGQAATLSSVFPAYEKELLVEMRNLQLTSTSIRLRLNPDECSHLLDHMNDIESCFDDPVKHMVDTTKVNDRVGVLVAAFQVQLKKEWARVKRGEEAYVWTKGVLYTIGGAWLAFVLFWVFSNVT